MKKKIIMLSTIPLGNKKPSTDEVKIMVMDELNEDMKKFHTQKFRHEPDDSGKIELSSIYGEFKSHDDGKRASNSKSHRRSRTIRSILMQLGDI